MYLCPTLYTRSMKQPDNLQPDINFLFEMGNIRYIDRFWRRFYHKDFSNVAEHHFRVFWVAMVIAAREQAAGQQVDIGKIAQMVLVHDITESRTGEVDYISRQYVDRKEEMAIDDMLEGTSVEEHFRAIWEEYEKRESLEAKIAKDADNLDVDFELAEQAAEGSSLQSTWREMRQKVADTKLFTESAKQLAKELPLVQPHDWHTYSKRNRHNAGDWKK